MACGFFLVSFFNNAKARFEADGHAMTEAMSRILLTLALSLLQSSALACVWFRMSCHVTIDASDERSCLRAEHGATTWVELDQVQDLNEPISCYLRSFYFIVVTFFTIGFGDIVPVNDGELVFVVLLIVNSCLFYAFLISSMRSVMANRDVATNARY